MLDEQIREAIIRHPSRSAVEVRQFILDEYQVNVAPTAVLRIRNESQRATNIDSARTKASERLHEKLDLTEELIASYLSLMNDDTIKVSERLMAMRDLRGWVKLAMDAAGESRESTEKLFEISEEWDLGFESRETN